MTNEAQKKMKKNSSVDKNPIKDNCIKSGSSIYSIFTENYKRSP